MSENNVIISIKSVQTFEDQEPETVELTTAGHLEPDGDQSYNLSYQESEVTGMEGTLTTFQIEKGRITLLRLGQFNSQMVFEEGRRHLSMYESPYGTLSVGVNTRKMRSDMTSRGGTISLAYDIEFNHSVAGMTTFEIQVREAGSLPAAGPN